MQPELEELYREAKRVLQLNDEEALASFLSQDMTPVQAAIISAAEQNVKE